MHKGIIFLTKAEDSQEAKSNVENFLEDYHNQLYDWYEIGGRWSDVLKDNPTKLSDCLSIVEGWIKDLEKEAEALWKEMLEEKSKNTPASNSMSAYLAKKYYDAIYSNLCVDTNVYDINTYEAEVIPEDLTDYWAVIVDIHY